MRFGKGLKKSRRSKQGGNLIIEFALSLTLLMVVFFGTVQFGYAFFIYNRLQSCVRAGARYASRITYDASTTSTFTNAVKNVVVYGSPGGGSSSILPGLTTGHVEVLLQNIGGVPRFVTVQVDGYVISSISSTFDVTLRDKPRVTFPFQGRYTPTI